MGATHQYSSIEQPARKATSDACVQVLALAAIIVGFTLIVATIFCLVQTFGISPSYSVTINSVSGLDPATDLGHKAAPHPEFNLTLGVASWRYWAQACADLGVYVEVSYRDALLATSSTLMQQICAGPRDAVKHPFIARGAGVVIPGPLLDSLAMDMLSGVPEFDVKLHGPCPRKRVWPCGPRMVGDADALRAECGMYH